jgi:ParB family chromosome partitioning protein
MKKTAPKKLALGKGLDALIPDLKESGYMEGAFFVCPIDRIRVNRFQPRRHFDETELSQLAASITQQGILQPLLVRKHPDGYELVAGERRLRAARLAGLDTVPAIVKAISDRQMLQLSIVENIQRQNLNPVEEADAYYRLMSEFGLTQDQVAEKVGKSRPAVANLLRLRQLPAAIKEHLAAGRLSMGHARAMLGLTTIDQQIAICDKILKEALSVRQTEQLVKRLQQAPVKRNPQPHAVYFKDLADQLSRTFGTRVNILRIGKRGKVQIEFYSDKDLDRLIQMLTDVSSG